MREEALRVLRSIALDVEAAEASRVGACHRIIEATKPATAPGPSSGPGTLPPWMKDAGDPGAKQ